MKRCRLKRYNFLIINKMNKENKPLSKQKLGNDFIADVISSNLKLLWWGWSTFWGIFMIGFAIFRYCL